MPPASLRQLLNIADFRLTARRILPRPIFDTIDGGAEDEWTLKRNESAFGGVVFLPKTLDGTPARDLSVSLFGHTLKMPVMIGPTALQGLLRPDGERMSARAAMAAGTGYALSHGSICTIEALAETGATPRFMQVFVYRDRSFTHEFIDRAAAAGYHGLILTIDNQFGGNRERDIRNGFTIPPKLGAAQVAAMAMKAGWAWRMRKALPTLSFANYVRDGRAINMRDPKFRLIDMLDPGMSWSDVDDIRKRWNGPFLLKSLVHPDEARRALDHGVDGVVVSNHGGRQVDGEIAALDALAGVVAAAKGMPVLMDSGVRSGADMAKALALGARAVLVGRPYAYGLAIAGEAGVREVIRNMLGEFDLTLALCGLAAASDLGRDCLEQAAISRPSAAPD
jgi:L-lactate dehydrogenase (cytochrome)/(S)-mandelate dehydrogenase